MNENLLSLLFQRNYLKANSTWINDIDSKDLSNKPIYAVLNTHNLDLILQRKYMPIVWIRPESPRVTGNPRNAMVCDTPYLQNEFGDPRFFYVFNLSLSFSTCSQSFKKSVRGNFWARTSLISVKSSISSLGKIWKIHHSSGMNFIYE